MQKYKTKIYKTTLLNISMAYYFESFPDDLKDTFIELLSAQSIGVEVDWNEWFNLLRARGVEITKPVTDCI